tara:strand:+ start:258 stop:1976 length:1719 start_codon:yes stop_codon:yes gene_type:complete
MNNLIIAYILIINFIICNNLINQTECLTYKYYGYFTDKEYEDLSLNRKTVNNKLKNQLDRKINDTLYIPIVFHNYHEIIQDAPSRSFCDYIEGNNDLGLYNENNNISICIERAENAIKMLNKQFKTAGIIFTKPEDTTLIVNDIKNNNNLFIYNNNWNAIKNELHINNHLNIYIDYCIGRENDSGNLECGSINGWSSFPKDISSTAHMGIAIKHSAFPGINNNSVGILAHEIGHVFNLLHLYHLPVPKNDNNLFQVNSNFNRELVNGNECNTRGDLICDTPGQPLQDVNFTFDNKQCIYHGFGGSYDTSTNTLIIGGSNHTGTYRNDFEEYTNFISHSNYDDLGEFWGTKDLPDTCFFINTTDYVSKCPDTLYNFLPIASNFLQWPSIMNNCYKEENIGFTNEQFANIRFSINNDYTACNLENACNYEFSKRENIPKSNLFIIGNNSCYFGSNTSPNANDCINIEDCIYDCEGNILSATKNILPEIFKIDHIHPNPFNTNTSIQFRQYITTRINLYIYDVNGKLIEKIIDNKLSHKGFHDVNWNASSYASGIYIIKLFSKNKILTHKIILIK